MSGQGNLDWIIDAGLTLGGLLKLSRAAADRERGRTRLHAYLLAQTAAAARFVGAPRPALLPDRTVADLTCDGERLRYNARWAEEMLGAIEGTAARRAVAIAIIARELAHLSPQGLERPLMAEFVAGKVLARAGLTLREARAHLQAIMGCGSYRPAPTPRRICALETGFLAHQGYSLE